MTDETPKPERKALARRPDRGKMVEATTRAVSVERTVQTTEAEFATAVRTRVSAVQHTQRDSQTLSYDCLVYIGSEDSYVAVHILKSLFDFVDALGYETWDIQGVERGSVFLRIKMWGKKVADKRIVRKTAEQLVQAAEAMTVDRALSENTERHGSVVAALAASVAHADSASFDLGTLQYVQIKDEDGKVHIRARAIGSREIAEKRLSENDLKSPEEAFKIIDADPQSIGTL